MSLFLLLLGLFFRGYRSTTYSCLRVTAKAVVIRTSNTHVVWFLSWFQDNHVVIGQPRDYDDGYINS